MYKLLCKSFIKDYKDTTSTKVRESYGTVFSIFSIVSNTLLVVLKIIISFITGSVSILADALNNLSDVGSNVATLFGFKLSNKHPDGDHPYGHGRMEYVSGMIVSFLILLMGFESIKETINKILNPQTITFTYVAVAVLALSILVKLLMANVNLKAGKDIKSDTLIAASQDSRNDALVTSSTLISLLVFNFTKINVDAYVGFIVSLFVLKSGIEIFKNVLSTILGKAPDKELIKDIEKTIKEHKEIHGIHDLMFHDYGPSQQFLTLHVEVSSKEDVINIHDIIDNIERELLEKYNILTTIHMDPVDYDDTETFVLRDKVKKIVSSINSNYSIHDFRVVKGPSHTNLVFDCLLPAGDKSSHEDIKKMINDEVNKIENGPYYCVIKVEHSFID